MDGIDISVMTDLLRATDPVINKDNIAMTYATKRFELFNNFFGEYAREGAGDSVKDFVTLKDTGNAQHVQLFQPDKHSIVNTDDEATTNWSYFKTSIDYNRVTVGQNMHNPRRLYKMFESKLKNMWREAAEEIQSKICLTPLSASDKVNPHGLAGWLSMGTDDSAGDWTGYSGRYHDGSGTTYNIGGIASSSSSNARWASYYADHKGNLTDYLLQLLFIATTELDFIPPVIPGHGKVGDGYDSGNFKYYTNRNVLTNLETILRKSDDRIGSDLGKYAHRLVYRGVPFVYVSELNTARPTLYGTDPIFGVNHDHIYVTTLTGDKFYFEPPRIRDNDMNVFTRGCSLTYAISSDNRQQAGFLISQQ